MQKHIVLTPEQAALLKEIYDELAAAQERADQRSRDALRLIADAKGVDLPAEVAFDGRRLVWEAPAEAETE